LEVRRVDESRQRRGRQCGLRADPRFGHRAGPQLGAVRLGDAVDAAHFAQPSDAMHLDVPDLGALERDDLPRGTGVAERFIEAHGGMEYAPQLGVADPLVRREWLLE